MASRPHMSCIERAERHKRIVAAYVAGASSRVTARMFGLSPSHVKRIVALYGVTRRSGRPGNDNSSSTERGRRVPNKPRR